MQEIDRESDATKIRLETIDEVIIIIIIIIAPPPPPPQSHQIKKFLVDENILCEEASGRIDKKDREGER